MSSSAVQCESETVKPYESAGCASGARSVGEISITEKPNDENRMSNVADCS